jgi:UDP-glucose 4-epimerase
VTVLVTGGAGYIGSHIVRWLREAGTGVVVVDDLSTGIPARVGDVPLLRADLADPRTVPAVADPARYYAQNVGQTAYVLRAA